MKSTIKSLLAAVGMGLFGLGTMLTATPAKAAYIAPFVPAGCTLYTKQFFDYPYAPNAGEYVYCGANPASYRESAGDILLNLPFASGSSMLRDKFKNANVTLYVFASAQAARTALNANGVENIPSSVLAAGRIGFTQTNAGAPATTQAFIAVWETYIDPITNTVAPVPGLDQRDNTVNRWTGAVKHETGHITDWLGGTSSSKPFFINSYNADATAFNAVPTCTQYPYPYPGVNNPKGPVCNQANTVVQTNYVGKSNVDILLLINTGYDRYFANSVVAGSTQGSEIFAEQVPIVKSGNHGGISGTLDDWIVRFGTCTLKYTTGIYNFWTTNKPAGCP